MANPAYYSYDQANVNPLHAQRGSELAKTRTIYASTVPADSDLRKMVPAGTLLVKITSGTGINKYGPYLKTASDGRESPAENGVGFTTAAYDMTVCGDKALALWYADCVFEPDNLTMGGYSLWGSSLTDLKAMFPTCIFYEE
ncbi:MAG: hypothetical protein DRP52_01060 [Planctomycetota bacterium]|nr:MAG: hypothetical protein DRP52_01060 [Planctomycetota bacterium]RLC83033.1 MAG: hypothetical protein DRJ03_18100 [Chloroflexota bacterium]